MRPVVALGTQDFEKIRGEGTFYVDKTAFIKEWWENSDDVTLITRPRRFGKTLNMSMVEHFFSNRYEGRSDLFEGLSVWEEEKYQKLQGTYPVIFLSFANIKGNTYKLVKKGILHALVKLYSAHSYVRTEEILDQKELAFFDSVRADMPEDVAVLSIMYLSDYLSRYYGKKTIILLDEYDAPLQEAYVNGFWDELISFVRNLFNSTFMTNPCLERALLTGITRISKESIFSDLNNLTVVTTTSEKYCTQFGFTEEETFQALDFFGLGDQKGKVKAWYNGFTFGSRRDIYNPWSITSFLDEKKLKPYWVNTSSDQWINKLIREGTAEIKISVEDLMEGKSIETAMDEEIIFDQLDRDDTALWSLLLAAGYLKVDEVTGEEEEEQQYRLSLTNLEVRRMFRKVVRTWFRKSDVRYNDFIKALLLNDVEYMNRFMNEMTLAVFGSFDTGNHPSGKAEPERFYHGFVLGLIADAKMDYIITSNRESGFGRYDVVMEPCDKSKNAYIFEFKVFDPARESSLEDTVKAALAQIEEKQYDQVLLSAGIPSDRIFPYGFAFEGKRVLIG